VSAGMATVAKITKEINSFIKQLNTGFLNFI
jgi:hypothetical protein